MATRPPFDPRRTRSAASAASASPVVATTGAGSLTVGVRQVNEMVRDALDRAIPSTLHVLGEIGDLSRPGSGHLYFTLKDSSSELRCVMWRSAAASVKFQIAVGMEVIATGGIEVYAPRGSYQLIVRRVEPRGVGALELAFRQLREKLEKEGLFDPARKRPLPAIPRRIALVTSPRGAAIRDILRTLERRFPRLDILVFPVSVQGAAAAGEIAAAIALMNRCAAQFGGIDLAIVGRGGGSLEDLWAFNEEAVARAIVASRIPIISAVGHEVDVTISDLVADLRAATPTAAAELAAPLLSALLEQIARGAARTGRVLAHGLRVARAELGEILARPNLSRPLLPIRERQQRVDDAANRLRVAQRERARMARERLTRVEHALARLSAGAAFARVRRRIDDRLGRVQRGLERLLARRRTRATAAWVRVERVGPLQLVRRRRGEVGHAAERVAHAAKRALVAKGLLLEARLGLVAALDPRHVLERGYTVTRDARTRELIRSAAHIRSGQRIITQTADGEFRATADDPRQPRLFE